MITATTSGEKLENVVLEKINNAQNEEELKEIQEEILAKRNLDIRSRSRFLGLINDRMLD